MTTNTIPVRLASRSYDVLAGTGLLAHAGTFIAPFTQSGRVFIVTDANVANAHLRALTAGLGDLDSRNVFVLAPGEQTKSFDGLQLLLTSLLRANIGRKDLVIAFGGGVIGDLAGLAAGLVKRGVDFVQIPTTLLAQVDSSVGGKTAIDTDAGKNLVGLIHQPRLVLADLDVLSTLPERERRAGYAEIVKAGLIADAEFFTWCERNARDVITGDPEALSYAITTAIAFKAAIVARDETERGERALLNLGHTFAHALEAHGGYSTNLLHGEAVAAGISLAFKLSADLKLCTRHDTERVTRHLEAAGFITDLRKLPGAPFDPEQLMQLIASDKKAQAGKLTFILARAIGAAFIETDTPAEAVRALLQHETQ